MTRTEVLEVLKRYKIENAEKYGINMQKLNSMVPSYPN